MDCNDCRDFILPVLVTMELSLRQLIGRQIMRLPKILS